MSQESREARLLVGTASYRYFPIECVEGSAELPLSLKILLENVLRNAKSQREALESAQRIVAAGLEGRTGSEIEFSPARVLFQDFTGVPVFVDFAAMREACADLGGDPARINPQIPCDLVIDHSVIADEAGCAHALDANMRYEYERNRERYEFLKWAQESFDNVRIVPPGKGICHQLNIENFASVVFMGDGSLDVADSLDARNARAGAQCTPAKSQPLDGGEALAGVSAAHGDSVSLPVVYFDTVVGTDSHTPTVNGIGVLGWGVGGIEAEAAALGQPITALVPQVIGVKLTGKLQPGVSAMDVSLTFASVLRAKGVVGCFVECFGEGVSSLSATQRTCVSNMTPEYGCTCTLFPIDDNTLSYLRLTGRSEEQVSLVEAYAKHQGLWHDPRAELRYADVVEIDLSNIEPSVAGPSRPHDRISRSSLGRRFREICDERGLDLAKSVVVRVGGSDCELTHGALAIAAITSCTTATDPAMMLSAGLVARNAARRGLRAKPWVKTIFAPGSLATELLLREAGLLDDLQALGFHTCGFGCMSCIGNSGPLPDAMRSVADEIELASVLSGNRNFEGRISPDVSQNYLTAPAHVVAYSIAGTVDVDLETDPLGFDEDGNPVHLADVLPSGDEVERLVATCVTAELYARGAEGLYEGDPEWVALRANSGSAFAWDESSTYVRRPPYFDGMARDVVPSEPVRQGRVIGCFGDFITTDHISPAGSIAEDSPAATYLRERGVDPADFNTYGSRRGNHEVMMRGTFANVKLLNSLAGGRRGGWTRDFATDEIVPLFQAAEGYVSAGVPEVVLAGKMYGSGSSRDWAAKGPMLLGVRAVIAESFERIHRSNLIGMGILPLQFLEGQNVMSLGLDGSERISVGEIDFSGGLPHPQVVEVRAEKPDGAIIEFCARVRIDTPTEGRYYEHGGILRYVLRSLA